MLEGFRVVDEFLGSSEKLLPYSRQVHSGSATVEQCHSIASLQRLNTTAQRGLREVKLLGRMPEAAGPRDHHEILQLVQV